MTLATELINSFGSTVTATRYAAGTLVDHEYVAGATSTFDCVISVQPLSDKELSLLPEGQRTKRILKGYSATELQTADVSTNKKADEITFDGVQFSVVSCETWDGDLSHWKIKLVQIGE